MEHQIINGIGKNRHFINNEVIGVKDILIHWDNYSEAINIVIENIKHINNETCNG